MRGRTTREPWPGGHRTGETFSQVNPHEERLRQQTDSARPGLRRSHEFQSGRARTPQVSRVALQEGLVTTVTPLLQVGLAVLLIFLFGFLTGLGVDTRTSVTRGKRQAARQRTLNEMWCALHEQQETNELSGAAPARPVAPYVYVTAHEEVD